MGKRHPLRSYVGAGVATTKPMRVLKREGGSETIPTGSKGKIVKYKRGRTKPSEIWIKFRGRKRLVRSNWSGVELDAVLAYG
jgi:hypothetical protein